MQIDPTSDFNADAGSSPSLRRMWVRLFFASLMTLFVLDALPWSWTWLKIPKEGITQVFSRVGLWQGDWPLFAPNPVVDNGWISADLFDTAGNRFHWNSPHWVQTNSWERFHKFRHLNYFNRLHLLHNAPAVPDFADYLAHHVSTDPSRRMVDPFATLEASPGSEPNAATPKPVAEIKVYRIFKQMSLPAEGPFPSREETIWTLRTQLIEQKKYSP